MTSLQNIITTMNDWAPEDTAEDWDNVGLQVHTQRDIEHVGVALELNIDTWDIIADQNYDLIITHHPLIFKPLYHINGQEWGHGVLKALIKKDTGLYVSHTNLDRADAGVSHALAVQYGLGDEATEALIDGYGRVARFSEPYDLDKLDEYGPAMAKICPPDLEVNSIAFCGGSGKSFVQPVIDQGISVLVTGELGYHDIQHLRQQGVGVVLLGHYQSEICILDTIQERIQAIDTTVAVDIIK